VKKSWFVRPLFVVPPPKSIPQSWAMTMFLPFVSDCAYKLAGDEIEGVDAHHPRVAARPKLP